MGAEPVFFEGRRVTGVGFDRDTLIEAGIQDAYAFAAVSSGDNSNILAARVARETFGVEHVVARIYDPGRAEVYQRLGIPTVDLEDAAGGRVAFLTRLGAGMLPGPDTVYQEGDLLHVATMIDNLAVVERILDAAPQHSDA